jgi:hypothetical protein
MLGVLSIDRCFRLLRAMKLEHWYFIFLVRYFKTTVCILCYFCLQTITFFGFVQGPNNFIINQLFFMITNETSQFYSEKSGKDKTHFRCFNDMFLNQFLSVFFCEQYDL